MNEVQDKVAIVTGGNRGIGQAVALLLAQEGATVIVAARDGELTAQTVELIQQQGGKAQGAFLDVADAAGAAGLTEKVLAEHGRVDIIVNNAGICQWQIPFEALDDKGWDAVMDVNVKGIVHMVRPLIPVFKRQSYGKIINLSSMAAQMGSIMTSAAYAASKAAVINMTMTLAKELGPYNVNVNAVAPGFIRTDMTAGITVKETSIPLKRIGEAQDVAEAVLFLASDRSRYITGATLDVNGGWNMR